MACSCVDHWQCWECKSAEIGKAHINKLKAKLRRREREITRLRLLLSTNAEAKKSYVQVCSKIRNDIGDPTGGSVGQYVRQHVWFDIYMNNNRAKSSEVIKINLLNLVVVED